ncbi:FMN-dependent NADH-azoreductase [Mycoplasma sp. OR1901]|uniref:FMN-dependent NADH-azoreductase n=1 Tax=Mycoplasma sp. OR1901 TaxID=2742195 RepID=UPI0015824316|nr:FMN-dependent NADH-azoreductase [Mycoplasma sp. OR1901]QKT05723.1 FMN-dependent NADH-azoreductase [Mycoplasma sp. OR1901]
MKKVLFLDGAFFTNEGSYTTTLLNEFEKVLDNVERVNLSGSEFDKTSLSQTNIATYWADVNSDKWINKLKETDLLVLSSTVVNFNVPTLVKNFIDAIAVADKTFSYKLSKDGNPVGLLNNLNVVIVSSQGGPKSPNKESIQNQWLRSAFKFVGAKSINFIEVYGTKVPGMLDSDTVAYAKSRVAEFKEIVDKL